MTTVKFATDVIISSHQKTKLKVSVYANQTESGITLGGQPTRNAHGGHPEQRKTGNCFIQMQIRNREISRMKGCIENGNKRSS